MSLLLLLLLASVCLSSEALSSVMTDKPFVDLPERRQLHTPHNSADSCARAATLALASLLQQQLPVNLPIPPSPPSLPPSRPSFLLHYLRWLTAALLSAVCCLSLCAVRYGGHSA